MKNVSDHNIIAFCLIIIATCTVINTINALYQQRKANDLISKISEVNIDTMPEIDSYDDVYGF